MNDLTRWQQGNEQYLAQALAWLRSRLTSRSNRSDSTEETDASPTTPYPLPPTPYPTPALAILSQQFGLSSFEQEVLLLCAAIELDTRIASLCARIQDDPNRPYPTFALALTLFDEPAWDVLSPERPLRYWRLIEINQPGAQPLTTSALRADERIVNYLKGLNYLDDRLAPLLMPLEVTHHLEQLPPSQQRVVDEIVHHLEQTFKLPHPPVIQLVGTDASSKQLIASQAAAQFGLHLYRLPVELLPTQAAELETLARLWQRESVLLPIALYIDTREVDSPSTDGLSLPLHRFLSHSNGLFFLDTREIRQNLGRPAITLDIAKPTPSEQQAIWTAVLGEAANDIPVRLAGQFNLNLATIQQIVQTVLTETPAPSIQNQLWDACLANTRPQLASLAQRLEPKATWNDIVLPAEEINLLHQIADQVRQRSQVYEDWGFHRRMNRGMGISALFAGESGTGKTMAAEVIANDLRLNLYRIDLSAVVSKYIGETEKNLRRLFDAAEDGGTLLFFDEADALFGKRSEVKDSHDRYANIEINYLLQRMEAYRGLAILATNMKSALDTAFVRRLRFIINFPFPGTTERKVLWQKVFPPETPTIGLDFDRLSRFNLTGGSIHNIALNAAFLAAKSGTPVTMQLVLDAIRTEFRKLDRPINEADFRVLVSEGVAR